MNKFKVGRKLRALRGKTPTKDVAKAIGLSTSAIRNYENGLRIPRDKVKVKLAKYYNTTVESIFYV